MQSRASNLASRLVFDPSLPDFCLIPIGTGSTSVAQEVAECQRVLEKSGVHFKASLSNQH